VGLFKRRTPFDYDGLALLGRGYVWYVTISRDDQQLSAAQLFDTEVLTKQLQEGGFGVESVTMRHGSCVISPSAKSGRTMPEGRKIRRVLRQHYPTYNGNDIHWKWDVAQYD
jgi:hypothetical protein